MRHESVTKLVCRDRPSLLTLSNVLMDYLTARDGVDVEEIAHWSDPGFNMHVLDAHLSGEEGGPAHALYDWIPSFLRDLKPNLSTGLGEIWNYSHQIDVSDVYRQREHPQVFFNQRPLWIPYAFGPDLKKLDHFLQDLTEAILQAEEVEEVIGFGRYHGLRIGKDPVNPSSPVGSHVTLFAPDLKSLNYFKGAIATVEPGPVTADEVASISTLVRGKKTTFPDLEQEGRLVTAIGTGLFVQVLIEKKTGEVVEEIGRLDPNGHVFRGFEMHPVPNGQMITVHVGPSALSAEEGLAILSILARHGGRAVNLAPEGDAS